jgi:hypothetical protein
MQIRPCNLFPVFCEVAEAKPEEEEEDLMADVEDSHMESVEDSAELQSVSHDGSAPT